MPTYKNMQLKPQLKCLNYGAETACAVKVIITIDQEQLGPFYDIITVSRPLLHSSV